MRVHLAWLLLAACSAEPRQEAAQEVGKAASTGIEIPQNQSRAIPGSGPAANNAAAAKIMAGGFRPDGSFVHGDHIHKPGQENCPSEMSGGPVQ